MSFKKKKPFYFWGIVLFLLTVCWDTHSQQIVDSCFVSVAELGIFVGSDDLKNACLCSTPYIASNLMEWDQNSRVWKGVLPTNTTLDLAPPESQGCLTKALWIGSESWTFGGEAFALRLDKPIKAGHTYSYSFKYAADGYDSDGDFEPTISTCDIPNLFFATTVDTLPPAQKDWITNTSTFTATSSQEGDTWLLVHTREISGTILSNCKNLSPLKEVVLPQDTVLCEGDEFILHAQTGDNFVYSWNDGTVGSSIEISEPGEYGLSVSYYYCSETDSIKVNPIDCDVRLTMPNFFSPNKDDFNPVFVPMEYNFIESGQTIILSRWGNEIFRGDLFKGWDGKVNGIDASSGVYYYIVAYQDPKGRSYSAKGVISLAR